MNSLETENIQSVTDTLSLILSFEDSEMWEAFADIYSVWDRQLISSATKQLSSLDSHRNNEYQHLCSTISAELALLLTYKDRKLLKELQTIRDKRHRYLLSVAARSLTEVEQAKLRKIIVLQNIANGEKSVDRPWEPKPTKAPPRRREFTKELLARV